MNDIEIVVVQGELEWVVATVDADDNYTFTTRVNVPRDATPGDAQMIAREAGAVPHFSNADPALRISAAPPVSSPPTTDTSASPTTPGPDATTAENDSDSQAYLLAVVAVVVAFAAGTLVVVVRRRSS